MKAGAFGPKLGASLTPQREPNALEAFRSGAGCWGGAEGSQRAANSAGVW